MTREEARAIIDDTEMGDFVSVEWCQMVSEAIRVLSKKEQK